MSFFKSRYPADSVEKALKKVRSLYTQMIEEFHFGQNFFQEFEDRYLEKLKNPKIDLITFLFYEFQTAQALYQQQQQKQEAQAKKQARYEAYLNRSLTEKIASQNNRRIEKYQRIEYSNDDELNALFGAVKSLYTQCWNEIDFLVSRLYKTAANNPLFLLVQDLLDFISKKEEEIPSVFFAYQRLEAEGAEEKALESEKNLILKKAGLMLNKIKRQLLSAGGNPHLYNQKESSQLTQLGNEVSAILADFRLTHFNG